MSSSTDNIFVDINKRIFFLSDGIDESSIGKMCFNILSILKEDNEQEQKQKNFERKPIEIYVNSFGGSVYDMWALIDIIENSKTPIYTYCTGYAMSAGFSIFLAGHKRYATKHATFLYHQFSGWRSGKYQDFVEDREEMDYIQNTIEQYVIAKTKFTKKQIEEIRKTKTDVYIHADKAVELGIIDEVIKHA